MSGLFMMLLGGAILGIDSLKTQYQTQKKTEELKDKGAFLPFPSGAHHDIVFDNYYNDFTSGERKHFPRQYWAYMERNKDAVAWYAQGLAWQHEINEGYRPHGIIDYNRYTFEPFGMFHARYDEKIEELNRNGVFHK